MPKSILVAEDSTPVRKLIVRYFKNNTNFSVCGEAATGKDALAKAAELQPDLIVLDMRMPEMSGLEVAPLLKQKLPASPIILFTIYDTPSLKAKKPEGVDFVLSKSDGLEQLANEAELLLA
jgi:two-component system, LytTR family, response regulator AlgR